MSQTHNDAANHDLVRGLLRADAYPDPCREGVELRETHISWVFLAGEFAYKVKKPVKTSFLDYSTLAQRQRFCREELRLDQRYAADLYIGVVPITTRDGRIIVGLPENSDHKSDPSVAAGPIEFAVKMHRFPDDALLANRLQKGNLSDAQVNQLAATIAEFHQHAARSDPHLHFGSPHGALDDMMDSLRDLLDLTSDAGIQQQLQALLRWTSDYFDEHQLDFSQRRAGGFIRECHGDLHLSNVIDWHGQLMPFDGVEFSEAFRWIDVLSDAAFLSMDFAARGHIDLSRSFTSAYLEHTGDHASLPLLRWYLVHRALVRAKVAAIRGAQQTPDQRADDIASCHAHVDLASQFTSQQRPTLWITHGLSGSGKSTGSELVVGRTGAIRLRSDVERKRHFGLTPLARPDARSTEKMYSPSANHATYGRLRRLAAGILQAGYSVIVDATFLMQDQRQLFHTLANTTGAAFAILEFDCDPKILRQRIADRLAKRSDASDADRQVLEQQIATQEPLSRDESRYVAQIPEAVSAISGL